MSEVAVSKRTYVFVWASLLMLLGLTVAIAYIHLGWFNATAAVSIAIIKAMIIIMYFMHVRYSPKLVWIFVGAGFLWLGFLFLFSMEDYLTRSYLPSPTVWLP